MLFGAATFLVVMAAAPRAADERRSCLRAQRTFDTDHVRLFGAWPSACACLAGCDCSAQLWYASLCEEVCDCLDSRITRVCLVSAEIRSRVCGAVVSSEDVQVADAHSTVPVAAAHAASVSASATCR